MFVDTGFDLIYKEEIQDRYNDWYDYYLGEIYKVDENNE